MAGTHLQFLVLLFCFLCMQFPTSAYTTTNWTVGHIKVLCIQREKQALLKLQSALVDEWQQPISSWGREEEDCCKWIGVLCSNKSGHIYSLHVNVITISSKSLLMSVKAGEYSNREISSSLLELQHLAHLDLSYIQGLSIPKPIGSFTKLTYLSLALCNLTGSIPHELGNLSRLVSLDLSSNYLANSESLMWLSHLPSLKHLDLSNINLSQAIDWLPAINSLPSLVELRLWSCGLSLKTPPPLLYGNSSSSLTRIEFYDNSLSSSIFPWLFNFNNSLVHLDLRKNELHGPIPDAFGSMICLQHLDLCWNHLEGEIPRAMENLFRLESLDLSRNNLVGKATDMKNFSSLSYLDISNNKLDGSLPESIWLLSNLQWFDISSNFFSGVVSEIHFLKLTKLTTLDFSSNSLSFNLSSNWVPPFQLGRLGMASCKLGPRFPQWLYTQHKLSFLHIPNAGISGIISSWFWELPLKLHYFNISNNHISGEVSKLSLILGDFPIVDASSNSFHGSIPLLPPSMTGLNLSKNKFSGTTSTLLCSMASDSLLFLDLSDNFLSGQLPDCWMPYINLAMLNLENNNFSGRIPASFGYLFQLQRLHLRNNSFSGELPLSMVDCVKLKLLDIGENKLSGTIPQWIGDFWLDLIVLRLRSNLFYGTMTPHLCHLASLQILDLSHNNISGSIPQCISDFSVMKKKEGTVQSFLDDLSPVLDPFRIVVLEYTDKVMVWWKGTNQEYGKTLGLVKIIDLSSNNLSGEIPGAITSLHGLVALNLSHNRLIGTIPLQIGQLELLDFLDFSANQLSGRLPDSLRDLHFLGRLNVSYNNLSGKIPLSTQLQSFDNTSFMGNEQLCGKPLPNKCPGEEDDYNPSTDEGIKKVSIQEGDDELISRGFYLSMGLGFGTGFWAVSLSLLLCRRWRHAFFRFMSHIEDWLYASIVLKIIILQRRFWN